MYFVPRSGGADRRPAPRIVYEEIAMRAAEARHPRAVATAVSRDTKEPDTILQENEERDPILQEFEEPDTPFQEGAHDALTADMRHRLISEAAYRLYSERGYADGYDLDDWLQAEAQVDHIILNPTG
jgi:hypothetical protein